MRRRAVLADTGPLFASVDPHDQFHGRAQSEGRRLGTDGFTVVAAYPIVFESYSLVMQRLGAAVAHRYLTDLREGSAFVAPTPDDYATSCAIPPRYADQSLSLFDALLSVLSARLGLPVWTYDADFEVMGVDVWR